MLAGDRAHHLQLGRLVGGDRPAVRGADQVPASTDRWLWESEAVLCVEAAAGNTASVRVRGSESDAAGD
jgi:hypothetical protein